MEELARHPCVGCYWRGFGRLDRRLEIALEEAIVSMNSATKAEFQLFF
jgi:hypothetical protein